MRLLGTWRPGGADIVPTWWPLAEEFVVGAGLLPLLLPPLFWALFLPAAGDADELLVEAVVVVVPELDDVELVVVVVDDPAVVDLVLDDSVAPWFPDAPGFRVFSFHVSPSDFPFPEPNSAKIVKSVKHWNT